MGDKVYCGKNKLLEGGTDVVLFGLFYRVRREEREIAVKKVGRGAEVWGRGGKGQGGDRRVLNN